MWHELGEGDKLLHRVSAVSGVWSRWWPVNWPRPGGGRCTLFNSMLPERSEIKTIFVCLPIHFDLISHPLDQTTWPKMHCRTFKFYGEMSRNFPCQGKVKWWSGGQVNVMWTSGEHHLNVGWMSGEVQVKTSRPTSESSSKELNLSLTIKTIS